MEAGYLFAQYLFQTFRLRKLYLEVPSFNLPMLGGVVAAVGHLEGVLKEHGYYNGGFWDRYVIAIYKRDLVGKSLRDALRRRDRAWLGWPPTGIPVGVDMEGGAPGF